MKKHRLLTVEIKNQRYADRDLREYLTEFVHYSKYAGIDLGNFHKVIVEAELSPGLMGPELGYGGKIILRTDRKTADALNLLITMYPVFSTWELKVLEAKKAKSKSKAKPKKEKEMAVKKKTAKKKAVAKKKPAKKKVAAKKKPAKKKAVAKKKPAKKKVAAKKKPAKKKAVAKKKPAKKKAVAKKKPARKKAVAKKK